MSEYYAIIRSTDHLAHYGIRGMKWGVRKARERGNNKALGRHYTKAQKKLAKLNRLANVQEQNTQAKKHNRRALDGLGVGLAGLGVYARNEQIAKQANKLLAEEALKRIAISSNTVKNRNRRIVGEGKPIFKTGDPIGGGSVGILPDSKAFGTITRANVDGVSSTVKKSSGLSPYEKIKRASAVIGMAGFGTAAYQKGRAIAAKRRTTKEGHARAVAKRNEFKREMDRAFAGTRYVTRNQNGKRKKRRS